MAHASKSSDGRVFVLDDGFAALRSAVGTWTSPAGITGDVLARAFTPLSAQEAENLAAEARAALAG